MEIVSSRKAHSALSLGAGGRTLRTLIKAFPPDMVAPIALWLAEFRRRRPQIVHARQDADQPHRGRGGVAGGRAAHRAEHASVRPDNPRRRLKRYMQHGYRTVLGHPRSC